MATSAVSPAAGPAPPIPQEGLSPAMRQYLEQKRAVGDAILLFRMGDFYETFFDDAVLCSKVLGIALTARNKGENPIPLAGIPYHALDAYLKKLVTAGYKVAISEQLEDATQAKGVIKRDVVRIVTAGTLTDAALLGERDDNTLAALCIRGEVAGLATVELASGRFQAADLPAAAVIDELVRLGPAEVIIDDEPEAPSQRVVEQLRHVCGTAVTRRPAYEFSDYRAEQSLLAHFGTATLAGFGFERFTVGLAAAGCIIEYLRETQKTTLSHVAAIHPRCTTDYVQIDHSSWRSLEISQTLRGAAREGTLLHAMDRTVNPIGARKLRHWVTYPLRSIDEISRRQDAVAWLAESDAVRRHVRELLRSMGDVERITSRVALARATPRDLRALGNALEAAPLMAERIAEGRVAFLCDASAALTGLEQVADLLRRAVRDEPANTLREGGIIRDGFHAELDRLYAIGRDGQKWLAEYQRQQVERTGLNSLKVGFNNVFGYYIEVSNAFKGQVPADYVRKQTVKNAERYITEELKRFEEEALTAEQRAHDLEYQLFEQVRREVAEHTTRLLSLADAVGRVDAVAGLAELAVQRRYVRPAFVDLPGRLEILDGRHPVLDQVLTDAFVPNDAVMDAGSGWLFVITGPNMAGKSTYIRQVALLTLMAHTGSFVPARRMVLSPIDRVFARVGASDELMRGHSTFMVEMTEAANILHNATGQSLVVLDELGRGTSTFDGLALAWAITEHLANVVRCRTLVATHYHEMTELADLLAGVRNYNVAVREVAGGQGREEGIIFLHKIVEGGADKSYGVHVARLAGVPAPVIRRSREILEELQRGFSRESHSPKLARHRTRDDGQLLLFEDPGEALVKELAAIDPDRMAPMDALQQIRAWKERLGA